MVSRTTYIRPSSPLSPLRVPRSYRFLTADSLMPSLRAACCSVSLSIFVLTSYTRCGVLVYAAIHGSSSGITHQNGILNRVRRGGRPRFGVFVLLTFGGPVTSPVFFQALTVTPAAVLALLCSERGGRSRSQPDIIRVVEHGEEESCR